MSEPWELIIRINGVQEKEQRNSARLRRSTEYLLRATVPNLDEQGFKPYHIFPIPEIDAPDREEEIETEQRILRKQQAAREALERKQLQEEKNQK